MLMQAPPSSSGIPTASAPGFNSHAINQQNNQLLGTNPLSTNNPNTTPYGSNFSAPSSFAAPSSTPAQGASNTYQTSVGDPLSAGNLNRVLKMLTGNI